MVDLARTYLATVEHHHRTDRANAHGWRVEVAPDAGGRRGGARRVVVARLVGVSGGVAAAAGVLGVVAAAVVR